MSGRGPILVGRPVRFYSDNRVTQIRCLLRDSGEITRAVFVQRSPMPSTNLNKKRYRGGVRDVDRFEYRRECFGLGGETGTRARRTKNPIIT